ncbi:phage tail protein [Bacillus sp. JJ722]|uniref:phage tail protein n=1 Tax=Bacillus sp. JJ722 TaxID=3122973 RepID=UPI0030006142
MSGAVRDLYVGIRFDDDISRDIERVDELVDNVRDSMERLGSEIDDVERNLSQMSTGFNGLDDIREDAIEARKALNDLSKTDVDIDIQGSESSFGAMSQGVMGLKSKLGLLSGAFSGAGAAAAPLLAGMVGLTASFAAADIGAAAFGAVAVSVLGSVFEASSEVAKLEEQIANADSAEERIAAQKELAAVYEGMSKSQQEALKNLQGFKSFWGGFTKQFEEPIFAAFNEGLQFTQKLLTGLGPTIGRVSSMVVSIMQDMNSALDSSGAKEFFTWLEINAAGSIANFATIGGNVLSGFFSLLQAFAPIGASMEEGLVSLTERFQQWSAGLSESNGFQTFVAVVQENGPKLMNIFGNIFRVIGDLVPVLAPFGAILIDVASKVTDVIVFLTSLLPSFSQIKEGIATTFSAIQVAVSPVKDLFVTIGSAIMGFVNEVVIPLIPVAQEFIMNAFQAMQPAISTVKGLFSTVSNVITTLINSVIVPLFPVAKEVISTVFNVINPIIRIASSLFKAVGSVVMFLVNEVVVPLIPKIATIVKDMWAVAKPILDTMTTVFNGIADAIDWAIEKFNSFASAVKKFKMPSFGLPKIMGGNGLIQMGGDGSHATGLARVPWDGYQATVHKDEAILTAKQSNALRSAGVLTENPDGTPNLNMDGGSATTENGGSTSSGNSPNDKNVFQFYITGENSEDIAEKVRKEIERFWMQMNMKQA